jgi:hypothetical protein
MKTVVRNAKLAHRTFCKSIGEHPDWESLDQKRKNAWVITARRLSKQQIT